MDEFTALYSMREIARDKKIMASQLVARGLLRARQEDGMDLVSATEYELDNVIEYHRRTFGQDHPTWKTSSSITVLETVVNDGLETLHRRKIIGKYQDGNPPLKIPRINALHFYATPRRPAALQPFGQRKHCHHRRGRLGIRPGLSGRPAHLGGKTVFEQQPDPVRCLSKH